MKNNIIIAIINLLLIASCTKTSYERTEDGVIINLKPSKQNMTRKIWFQVITDNIIRVVATPDEEFSNDTSLIAAYPLTTSSGWSLIEEKKQLILQTAAIKAKITMRTGEVRFTDLEDNVILAENTGGGKTFEPMSVDCENAYTIHQIFESPGDEAFYGLGQHQSDEFNYKGKNEVLYQYNTKVSVPFIISNKNYGILWENYSLTRFGDSREYAQMDQFILYGKDGKTKGGLTALYENSSRDQRIERVETTIDYENLESIKNFPQGFSFNPTCQLTIYT